MTLFLRSLPRQWAGRRPALALLLAFLVGGGVQACGPVQDPPRERAAAAERSDDAASPERPNILIYLVDTLRHDHLGVYGYDRDTSPNLDRFSHDAVVFDEAYAPSAWTKASVASLLTGLNPPRHGALSRRHVLADDVTVLGERLKELGYHTAAFVTNPHVLQHWGFGQGFDAFYDLGMTTADRVNEAIIEHMTERKEQPFFYYVHTIDPHAPYDPERPYDTLFTDDPKPVSAIDLTSGVKKGVKNLKAMYDGEVFFSDVHFGRLVERLQKKGLYDGSVIVFVSDHGEEHFEHGKAGHGQQLFNEVIRIPMIVKLPGNAWAGTRVQARASLIDVVPTILSLLGRDVPDEIEGIDLLPILSGDLSATERPLFFDLDLVRWDGTLHVSRAIISRRHKYMEKILPEPEKLLFFFPKDRREKTNVLEEKPLKAKHLAALLEGYYLSLASGIHVRLVSSEGGLVQLVEGRLRTNGQFSNLRASELEEGDQVILDEGGESLTFRLSLRDYPSGDDDVELIQDIDSFVFSVEPPDARVRLEGCALDDGTSFPVLGGPERLPQSLPMIFDAQTPALAVAEAGELFRPEIRAGQRIPAGCYVFTVTHAAPVATDVVPDHIKKRIEELGYGK